MLFKFLIFFIYLLISGCSHNVNNSIKTQLPQQPQLPQQDVKNYLLEFSKNTGATHINSKCRLLNLDGIVIRSFNGINCIFGDDGSTVVQDFHYITKYSKINSKVWSSSKKEWHHQLDKSVIADEYLTLSQEHKNWGNKKNVRFDILAILNSNGKIIKKFHFYDFYKNNLSKLNTLEIIPEPFPHEKLGATYELGHHNNLSEMYSTVNGVKVLTGYIAACTMQKQLYILNTQLTEVIKIINLNNRVVHTVKQIDEDNIIFYVNNTNNNNISHVETYNLKTNEFNIVYSNSNFYSTACGSAQLINKNYLFILHSKCGAEKLKKYESVFEFVDLKKNKNTELSLTKVFPYAWATFINADSYLKLNKGF